MDTEGLHLTLLAEQIHGRTIIKYDELAMTQPNKLTKEDLDEFKAVLPEGVLNFMALIGSEATAELINAYAGVTFPVSKNVSRDGQVRYELLSEVIGSEAAKIMTFHYGGEAIYIPNCKEVLCCKRNNQIKRSFDALSADHSSVEAVFMLSAKFKLSDRWIWNVLKT